MSHRLQRVLVKNVKFPLIIYNNKNNYATKMKQDLMVNQVEKIVGYPTSFLSLRWLLNDEIANVALHLRKLIGTDHPLLNTARDLLLNKQQPSWGLIVLLVSKAAGFTKEVSQVDCDSTAGILHSQRVLAEITEMIRTSNVLHKSVLNISKENYPNMNDFNDLHFGNKLGLLTGDYLLSTSFRELAGLKCHDVNLLISTCLRDLTEADFIEPRTNNDEPFPARPLIEKNDEIKLKVPNQFDGKVLKVDEVLGRAETEWTLRQLLGGASLLAKCCQGSLMLAKHRELLQKSAYLLGRNLALAIQANNDISIFNNNNSKKQFSLINAPLLYHLEYAPSYYDILLKQIENKEINYGEIKRAVKEDGPGLKKCEELKEELGKNALKALEDFPENPAKDALVNLVNAL